ncbi:MAG: Acetylxylan esterase, partial [Verrucomicrobiota bacterium]|nr:Acetylxylan esterase [Verrucomicrobiota bacterium]
MNPTSRLAALLLLSASSLALPLAAQAPSPSSGPAGFAAPAPRPDFSKPFWEQTQADRQLVNRLSQEDHQDMLKQLGIT